MQPHPHHAPTQADLENDARAALARGDRRAALTALVRAYAEPVQRFCLRMLGDLERARDVRQTVFTEAWRDLGRVDERSSLRGWLFTIARHRCLDELKCRRRFLQRISLPGDLPEHAAPAEEPAEWEGLTAPLARSIAALQPEVQAALRMRFGEDLSFTEMERTTGVRATTLQARVARALPVLRRSLLAAGLGPAELAA